MATLEDMQDSHVPDDDYEDDYDGGYDDDRPAPREVDYGDLGPGELAEPVETPTTWPPYEMLRFFAVTEGIELHEIGPDQSMAAAIAAHLWLVATGAATMEYLPRYGRHACDVALAILAIVAGHDVPDDPSGLPPLLPGTPLPHASSSGPRLVRAEGAMGEVDALLDSHPRRIPVLELVERAFRLGIPDPRMVAVHDVVDARLP